MHTKIQRLTRATGLASVSLAVFAPYVHACGWTMNETFESAGYTQALSGFLFTLFTLFAGPRPLRILSWLHVPGPIAKIRKGEKVCRWIFSVLASLLIAILIGAVSSSLYLEDNGYVIAWLDLRLVYFGIVGILACVLCLRNLQGDMFKSLLQYTVALVVLSCLQTMHIYYYFGTIGLPTHIQRFEGM